MADDDGAEEPHIVLYFDVNKTVIMHDPVQGKGLHHILNDLLCERALGSVSDDGDVWTWNGKTVINGGAAYQNESEVSYGTFLRAKYPLTSDPKAAKDNKRLRKIHRQGFTSPGNPGEGLVREHNALLKKIQMPEHDPADPRVVAAGLNDSPYHFIIPAFFALIRFLHERGTSFNLVFRTYGDDLHRIAQEFNLFCSGQHPFFSPGLGLMDGSDGSIDRRLHLSVNSRSLHRFGTFYRSDETTALVMGTFRQPESVLDDYSSFYEAVDGVHIIHGIHGIHDSFTNTWRALQATLAIRDFYPHWFSQSEDARAGKLMSINTTDSSTHSIFFDDNILVHDPHIVDARSYPDGRPLEWSQVRDRYLMRVEPLDAVLDDQYFIKRLLSSLHKRRQESQQLTEVKIFFGN